MSVGTYVQASCTHQGIGAPAMPYTLKDIRSYAYPAVPLLEPELIFPVLIPLFSP